MFSEYRTVCKNVLPKEMEEVLRKEEEAETCPKDTGTSLKERERAPSGQQWDQLSGRVNDGSTGTQRVR